jgi:hypothetical protein
VRLLTCDHLRRDDAFFLSLVREQLSTNCVSDRIDVGKIGAHLRVNLNLTARAELEAERTNIDSGEDRLATY